MENVSSVSPVFIKVKDIPDSDSSRPSVLDICLSAERTAGSGSIIGAQEIRGLWRLYPATKSARSALLVQGMRLRDTLLQVANSNPFIVKNDTGEEKPVTKLWIDYLPISVADAEVEHSIAKLGCELRSSVKLERARDTDGKLTRFLTGRRFVFITIPAAPLEKTIKISFFTVKLYHKEQKLVKNPVCSRCLEVGHHVSSCEKDIVCYECKQLGHKRGDPVCQFSVRDEDKERRDSRTVDKDVPVRNDPGTAEDKSEDREKKDDRRNRGRTNARQTTLRPTLLLDQPRRHRSETPKRRRSKEASPDCGLIGGKQPRRDDDRPTPDDATPAVPTDITAWR